MNSSGIADSSILAKPVTFCYKFHIYINIALDCEQSSAHASRKAVREGPAVGRTDSSTS